MQNLRPFQIGLLLAFAVVAIVSIVALASFKGFSVNAVNPYGNEVVIWGTLDESAFSSVIYEIIKDDKNFQVVKYVQKDERTFKSELVNAIADDRGPDAIVLSHADLVSLRSKLQPFSYSTISRRTLRDTHIDGAEIFALQDGLYAVPFLVDPLLMYWNRDLFSTGGIAGAPATWESLTDTVEQLTLRDATRNIQQATVAFGEYINVIHPKDVLLTLLHQSGSQLVEEDSNRYRIAINTVAGNEGLQPLHSVAQFYTEFSNSASPLYSWNRTFQDDRSAFLGEKLALYFAPGSEYQRLLQQNPNLNFDAANVPQGSGATVKRVYGEFYGLAIIKASANPQGAYRAILRLTDPAVASVVSESLQMAPTHRSLLAAGSSDPIRQVIFTSALIARGWLDPGSDASNEIFRQMVEDIVSGRQKVSGAVIDTVKRLELAF